jgi:predicted permease
VLDIILSALLPMVVTFLLGFVAARRHDFGSKDAPTLNRMVLQYAVPLALFAGTVTTSRAALSKDIPLVIALCAGIIGFYGVVFLFSRIVLRMQVSMSALAALTASAPAVPFVGPAVLGDLFGGLSAIPIALGSLVINLTVVPITILLLALNSTEREPTENTPAAQGGEQSESSPRSYVSVFAAKLVETVKEPIVWAPVIAFVIVLIGLHISQVIVHSLSLLGQASGRRRALCLRDRACIRQNQSHLADLVFCIPEKRHTARARARWFAMARLWQSRRERGGSYDGDSDHADCDHVCSAVSHRAGGGRFRRVLQRDGLGRNDGVFHRPNTIDE